jgi:hypothetical protein
MLVLAACHRRPADHAATPDAGTEPLVPNLAPRKNVVATMPHTSYLVRFDRADGESPFDNMQRTPLILKLDDFGAPLEPIGVKFFEYLDSVRAVASIGVITSRVTQDDRVNAAYRKLNAAGFELWFHGHTHYLGQDFTEFHGSPLEKQIESFQTGLKIGEQAFGVTFASFGAPGNEIDAATSTAVARTAAIKTWLYGPPGSPIYRYPRIAELEQKVGVVGEPSVMLPKIEAALSLSPRPDAVTLQGHPFAWSDADLARAKTIVDALLAERRIRMTTPTEAWWWREDQGRLRISKCTPTAYLVDGSAAEHPHRIETTREGPSVVSVQPGVATCPAN